MNIPGPLITVVRKLGELRQEVVFVGGMIRSLLVTDPAAAPARPTEDVDLIVDVANMAKYVALQQALRVRGFREDREEGAPACRWIADDVRVDVMPIDPAILGYTNVWYAGASVLVMGTAEEALRVLGPAHFCATKVEAFRSRGGDDYHHKDLEDYIALVEGRETLLQEIKAAPSDLRQFLAGQTRDLLSSEAFLEALPGHLAPDAASQARLPLVRSRLQAIADLLNTGAEAVASAVPAPSPVALTPGRLGAPTHVFVRSSNLHWASYEPNTSVLTVEFLSGTRYEYYAVPEHIYRGLILAASAGRYHHQWIRGRYGYRRL